MSLDTPNVVALIPAKANSLRVPSKNFREFHAGHSLLEIKIQQCLAASHISDVYVSSDTLDAEEIARRAGAKFLLRDKRLTLDDTPWPDVLSGILDDIPVPNSTYVAWAPLTSPLFSRYDDAVEMLLADARCDSVMTVTRLQHYYMNENFVPINYQWGVWAKYTQNLAAIYQMNCALWLATKGGMKRNRYQIGDSPNFMQTDAIEGLDIDTAEEFEMAQFFYARRHA